MKNIVISVCFLAPLFLPALVLSQNTFFSVGGEIAFPNSSGLKMVAGTALGGSLRVESSWGKHVAGMATVGYLVSPEKNPYPSAPATTSSYKALPVQIGIKFYTREKEEVRQGLFFSGEAGLIHTTTHFTFASNPDNKRKETDLAAALGVGYLLGKLETSFRLQFDLTDAGFNVYYYNIRAAYAFLRKKN